MSTQASIGLIVFMAWIETSRYSVCGFSRSFGDEKKNIL